jgi:ubiquinone/menaquinone biosynthesis C-methylase UbiE
LPKLGEEVHSLDLLQNKPCTPIHSYALAGLGDGKAASMSEVQCADLGVQARGVEAGAEQAQDLAVPPREHLCLAPLSYFRELRLARHFRGGIICLNRLRQCDGGHIKNSMTTIDYDAWARQYDSTRGASPSVLWALLEALGLPEGRSLLDIGGGTGNFANALADEGFRVALCDYSPEMARRASAKLGGSPVFVADAPHLPVRKSSFDCAISVNVLGHVEDWRSMLAEARRVIRSGPYVMKASTRETLTANWVMEYLPGIRDHAPAHHYQPESVIIDALRDAGFSRVQLSRVHYTELVDGSIQALKHFPEVFLDDERIMNTATLKRLPAPELDAGLVAIRRDYESGRLQEVIGRYVPLVREYGDGSVFAAWP